MLPGKENYKKSDRAEWIKPLAWSLRLWLRYLGPITFLMLVAALGRAFQMKAAGPVSPFLYWFLEMLVAFARILTLLVIGGFGSIRQGGRNFIGILKMKSQDWRQAGAATMKTFSHDWAVFLMSIIVFSCIAFVMNRSITLVAANDKFLQALKDNHILVQSASGMPVVFFLKNLTVIPFTMIFDVAIVLWLCGKLTKKV